MTTTKTPINQTVDALGCRKGTKLARLNAQLRTTPRSMRELVERAGLEGTFYNHLNRQVKLGRVLRDADGKYRLPGKGE